MDQRQQLKEKIRALVQEMMSEENATGAGEAISTPKAFDKNIEESPLRPGQKPSGRRYIPDTTIIPASLKPGAFKLMSNGETLNLFISPIAINALNALTRGRSSMAADEKLPQMAIMFRERMPTMSRVVVKKALSGIRINNQPWIPVNVKVDGIEENGDIIIKVPKDTTDTSVNIQNKLYEQLDKIIDQKLLEEGTYSNFKNDIKHRTKSEQLHKAIKEVNRKLTEIDRLVEYTSRMKSELSEGEEGLKYWKSTQAAVGKIQETITQLSNKLKNLNQ